MNQDEIYINNDNLFADVWHMFDTFRTKLSYMTVILIVQPWVTYVALML